MTLHAHEDKRTVVSSVDDVNAAIGIGADYLCLNDGLSDFEKDRFVLHFNAFERALLEQGEDVLFKSFAVHFAYRKQVSKCRPGEMLISGVLDRELEIIRYLSHRYSDHGSGVLNRLARRRTVLQWYPADGYALRSNTDEVAA